LLRNDGGGSFARIVGLAIEDGGPGQGAAWGDFDNDGDLDLFVANYGTADKLIRNEGDDHFAQITTGPLGDLGNGTGVAWGDCDNDGDLDLYLANYGQANKLLRNEGGTAFTAITSGPLGNAGNGTGAAWADYDLDGDLDLYLVNDGQSNVLMRNDLVSSRHWLELRLVGTVSNRSAIGTRVELYSGGTVHVREVSGGSGYMSQNELPLHFGLGSASQADSILVWWPSGLIQRHFGIFADRRLTLIELEPVAIDEPTFPRPTLSFSAPAPNPVRGATRFEFTLPRDTRVRLRLFGLDGREVATLLDDMQPAGTHSIAWSGVDRAGRRVASGIYLVRLEAAGSLRTHKIVLLR
ncbi:MAG TPA: FG-GAP-like repeat-containing protein, partial [Candidatus Eisenbacteria bacterium]|nr:FG-GAP-like repeat-containing protein [Candidatus Eisenbacteria bacterium]